MLKAEMEQKLNEYEDILFDIGRWCFPQQYEINISTSKGRLLFHLEGIRKLLMERFYKEEE